MKTLLSTIPNMYVFSLQQTLFRTHSKQFQKSPFQTMVGPHKKVLAWRTNCEQYRTKYVGPQRWKALVRIVSDRYGHLFDRYLTITPSTLSFIISYHRSRVSNILTSRKYFVPGHLYAYPFCISLHIDYCS